MRMTSATKSAAAGGEVIPVVGDSSKPEHMEAAVAEIGRAWQRLDIVVANAGINGLWAPLDEVPPDDWNRTLGVSLSGTFFTLRAALPLLKVAGGSVIIVSSVNGTRIFSNAGTGVYAVSKAGQVALSKKAAIELAQHRVRVNAICPGSITTCIDASVTHKALDKIEIAAK
jgi:NAD(P)-dependent dehydrogenase (short-subunit alcohol dehydrogenase family)